LDCPKFDSLYPAQATIGSTSSVKHVERKKGIAGLIAPSSTYKKVTFKWYCKCSSHENLAQFKPKGERIWAVRCVIQVEVMNRHPSCEKRLLYSDSFRTLKREGRLSTSNWQAYGNGAIFMVCAKAFAASC